MVAKPKGVSKKEQGENNAKLVLDWIATTPLRDVPRNQFGRADVTRILDGIIHISVSSRTSNKTIRDAISELNDKLAKSIPEANADAPASDGKHEVAHVAAVHRELARLQKAVSRFEYLENTGKTPL